MHKPQLPVEGRPMSEAGNDAIRNDSHAASLDNASETGTTARLKPSKERSNRGGGSRTGETNLPVPIAWASGFP